MGFLDRIRAARDFDKARFVEFRVEGGHCGSIRPAFAQVLARWPAVFEIGTAVELAGRLRSPAERTAAVGEVLQSLRAEGQITGWRDEPYPVAADFGGPPLLTIERAAARPFGIRTRGAHLNGFIGRGEDCAMWIARRTAGKPIDPSMLDNLVGGGIGLGFDPRQTLLKECGEEAGIVPILANRVEEKSTVLVLREVPEGVHWEILHVFDLGLEREFQPENRDGEVSGFQLLPIAEVRRLVQSTAEFTVDAALVALDFMLRHDLAGVSSVEKESLAQLLRGTPHV